jgi:FixJ family two-component response regulator
MIESDSIVFIVDDDPSFRRSSERMLRIAGYTVESFPSPTEFLERSPPDIPACLVTDLHMPGMNGLDFQQELASASWHIPIIFVTGHGDVPSSVRAMKAGAIEFLMKPFQEQEFLGAVADGLKRDRIRRGRHTKLAGLQQRYQSLTPREREVLGYVVAGLLNKQTAAILNVAEKTVKFHRSHIMEKMQTGSLAALVQAAVDLDLTTTV